MKNLVFTLLFLTSLTASADRCQWMYSPTNKAYQKLAPGQKPKEMTLLFHNVRNLFNFVGKFERVSATEFKKVPGKDNDERPKPEYQIDALAKLYDSEKPDGIFMAEVDTLQSLTNFNRDKMNDQMQPILVEGNDKRGIDVGALINRSLNLDVQVESHKDLQWFDPIEKKNNPLFSRDLLGLLLKTKGSDRPFMIVLVQHMKSRRDRPGDPESQVWRRAQAEATVKIIAEYEQKYGKDTPIITLGDFNDEIATAYSLAPLRENLKEVFDIAKNVTPEQERASHSYFPKGQAPSYSRMDAAFVNQAFANNVEIAYVLPLMDHFGNKEPLPQTFLERERQSSDHRALKIKVKIN